MFLLDDLLVKPFVSILDILQTMALNELFDVEQLQDDLKENRLMYELGERTEDEYERTKQELERQIEMARDLQSQLQGKVEIKG